MKEEKKKISNLEEWQEKWEEEWNKGLKHIREEFERAVKLVPPERAEVPQYVADWYEGHKQNLQLHIYCLFRDLSRDLKYHKNWVSVSNKMFANWYSNSENKPLQTLEQMRLFGYTIKKEKLYTVEIPNPNSWGNDKTFLSKNKYGEVELFQRSLYPIFKTVDNWYYIGLLTEAEIKVDYEWAWDLGFAKEVSD